MSKRTVIVSGGLLEEEFVLPILQSEDTEFIIGVDRGLVFLHDHDIKPDYIVGDFDSAPDDVVTYYREETNVPDPGVQSCEGCLRYGDRAETVP